MPVADSVDPASWRQGLRKTGIVLVPSKGEKCLVRAVCAYGVFFLRLLNNNFNSNIGTTIA